MDNHDNSSAAPDVSPDTAQALNAIRKLPGRNCDPQRLQAAGYRLRNTGIDTSPAHTRHNSRTNLANFRRVALAYLWTFVNNLELLPSSRCEQQQPDTGAVT
ncbi:MAG: hypothetical protein JWR34_4747 [Mycobacterium sp.]|nr:hypothetical protein [Mycobacterium sp.]